MTAPKLPEPVAILADQLSELPGAVAVALGGSRAAGTQRPDSDWDLGLYYRGGRHPIDSREVRRLGYGGYVSEPGEWGPIVNGGAWLTVDGIPVDILFRDLDTIERWMGEAREGRFEVLLQNGSIAGAPTYLPVGELAIALPITGSLPCPRFPEPLSRTAFTRWNARAAVALMFARLHAQGGDAVCCSAMLSNAILCAAHARLAGRREWVLNEKRLVERAELDATQALMARPGATPQVLARTVTEVSTALGIEPLAPR